MSKAKKLYVKEHNQCAVCGYKKNLEVHHVVPVHVDPTLSAKSSNFITLCDYRNKGCHNVFGHFRNFRSKWNPNIRVFALQVSSMLELCKNEFESSV